MILNRPSCVCCTMKMSNEQTFYEAFVQSGDNFRANTGAKPQDTVALSWMRVTALAFVQALKQPSLQPQSKRKGLQVNQEILGPFLLLCFPFKGNYYFSPQFSSSPISAAFVALHSFKLVVQEEDMHMNNSYERFN